jgi:hypothetical protein
MVLRQLLNAPFAATQRCARNPAHLDTGLWAKHHQQSARKLLSRRPVWRHSLTGEHAQQPFSNFFFGLIARAGHQVLDPLRVPIAEAPCTFNNARRNLGGPHGV